MDQNANENDQSENLAPQTAKAVTILVGIGAIVGVGIALGTATTDLMIDKFKKFKNERAKTKNLHIVK